MKYQKQTKAGDNGDCFSTCVANLLGIRTQNVPNFCQNYTVGDDWYQEARTWVQQYGFDLTWDEAQDHAAPCIAVVELGSSTKTHAILWESGKVLHDPSTKKGPPSYRQPPIYFIHLLVNVCGTSASLPRGETQCCKSCLRYYYAEKANTCPRC